MLTIRKVDRRPPEFAIDGCTANPVDPVDSIYRTTLESRMPHKEALVSISDQCNSCCQARAINCSGYITGNWIDIDHSFKPKEIFERINVTFEDLAQNGEADCICLENKDLNKDMNERYQTLIDNMRTSENPLVFDMLSVIVGYWNAIQNYFQK
ncbi:hypothetical protein EZMO1_4446 [Endozoicomonas montiporae CL-33]|nr:hypothetical protein EZMO1_4446 [Endozoicomonas montiporae CL-33]